eukprot:1273613-Rhodomonas_salina.5
MPATDLPYRATRQPALAGRGTLPRGIVLRYPRVSPTGTHSPTHSVFGIGTDVAYAATRRSACVPTAGPTFFVVKFDVENGLLTTSAPRSAYALAMRCPVLLAVWCYALPGTGAMWSVVLRYGTLVCDVRVPGRINVAVAATIPDLGALRYLPTRVLRHAWY